MGVEGHVDKSARIHGDRAAMPDWERLKVCMGEAS